MHADNLHRVALPPASDPIARANALRARWRASNPEPVAVEIAASSGIGDALAKEFGHWWITAAPGCGCGNMQARLNAMTAGQVRGMDRLAEKIAENAEQLAGVSGVAVRTALKISRRACIAVIQSCIERAISNASST